MSKRMILAALALVCLLGLGARATAQDDDLLVGPLPIGVIPGTTMTHDEFRARAQAQLSAVALNALTYRVLNGDYPATLYDLYNSQCWNIDLANIFTGQPVDAIIFDPSPEDMTSSAEIGLPFDFQYTPPAVNPPVDTGGEGEGTGEGSGEGGFGNLADQFAQNISTERLYYRVNPTVVPHTTPGDIFYYAEGELLQLVMYSGDGLYYEYFEVVPNGRWVAKIQLRETGGSWQQDVLAAQVLFFAGEMLPQFYNHVQFMSDMPPLAYSAPQRIDPATVLEMAAALDLTILNPSSHQPITITEGYSRGDFGDSAATGTPELAIGLQNGKLSTLQQLYDAYASARVIPDLDQRKPHAPPLGGRR